MKKKRINFHDTRSNVSATIQYISHGRTKEMREIEKWKRLPPAKYQIMSFLKEKRYIHYALVMMEYNKPLRPGTYIGAGSNHS